MSAASKVAQGASGSPAAGGGFDIVKMLLEGRAFFALVVIVVVSRFVRCCHALRSLLRMTRLCGAWPAVARGGRGGGQEGIGQGEAQ